MPGIDFDQVRARVSIRDVLELLDFVPSARQGDQLRGPCPVHGSSRPQSRSFAVHLGLGRYFCFQCRSHGNALELWAAVRGTSVYAAALELCRKLGITIPWLTPRSPQGGRSAVGDCPSTTFSGRVKP